jgi:hypothetical protein
MEAMTKRRITYILSLLLLTVLAYGWRHWSESVVPLPPADADLVAKSCAGEPLAKARPFLASDAVDKRLQERYGEVCRSLTLDPHLHFGIGIDAYQCRIWLPRQVASPGDQRQLQLITTLFGHRGFDLMINAHKAGTEATVLLVTDDGEDVAAISDQQGLKSALQRVIDLQGAAELVGLLNDTGRLAAAPSLCGLNVTADAAGWTLRDVKIPENCAPPWWRSYHIARDGRMQLLSSNKRWWRFDAAICSD